MIYQKVLKPFLFSLDPEVAHTLVLKSAKLASQSDFLCSTAALLIGIKKINSKPCKVFGLDFPNRVGLAAGFDKNCEAFSFMQALGFGHIEIGTLTKEPQAGNEKPRMWRLPEDEGLINRLGFPSEGLVKVLPRLEALRARQKSAILGVNLGKNKTTNIDLAFEDYLAVFKSVKNLADYFVLNISSPNTPDLRKLQEPARLKELFSIIKNENTLAKPILVKIAPDLEQDDLVKTVEACLESNVSGLIATNTTNSREGLKNKIDQQGGLSGKPLFEKSLAVVENINKITEGKIPLIAVGGISTADDILRMIDAGASLVQIYSSLVYQGPSLVSTLLGALELKAH